MSFRREERRWRFEALTPFVEGSEESIPSLRRRIVWVAERGVEKNAPVESWS